MVLEEEEILIELACVVLPTRLLLTVMAELAAPVTLMPVNDPLVEEVTVIPDTLLLLIDTSPRPP